MEHGPSIPCLTKAMAGGRGQFDFLGGWDTGWQEADICHAWLDTRTIPAARPGLDGLWRWLPDCRYTLSQLQPRRRVHHPFSFLRAVEMLGEWGTSRDASLCESLVHYRKRLSPARSLIRFRANSTAP